MSAETLLTIGVVHRRLVGDRDSAVDTEESKGSAVTVEGLTVRRANQLILNRTNLVIPCGKFVSIIGASGSGKTTLLLALAGLIPYDGTIHRPSKFGIVFQNNGVFPFKTVAENILFGLRDFARDEKKEILHSLLEATGLSPYQNAYPGQLSGGQLQRLNFARALAPRPELLLCDESFSALDDLTRFQLQDWLAKYLATNKCTIVFVTHSMDEAAYLSDKVLVLKKGSIAAELEVEGTPARARRSRSDERFFGLKERLSKELLS